jgi:hypothetical protein
MGFTFSRAIIKILIKESEKLYSINSLKVIHKRIVESLMHLQFSYKRSLNISRLMLCSKVRNNKNIQ